MVAVAALFMVARIGFSATTSRESRQGRKAEAAAAMSGAGVSADASRLHALHGSHALRATFLGVEGGTHASPRRVAARGLTGPSKRPTKGTTDSLWHIRHWREPGAPKHSPSWLGRSMSGVR